MLLVDTVAHLLDQFAKLVTYVFLEIMKVFRTLLSLTFATWTLVTVIINAFWILQLKVRRHIILPMVFLTMVNILFVVTSVQLKWLFSVKVIYIGADLICKFLKWMETSFIVMSSGLIIYIIILFRNPQAYQSGIKKVILRILAIIPIITFPQVRFKQ